MMKWSVYQVLAFCGLIAVFFLYQSIGESLLYVFDSPLWRQSFVGIVIFLLVSFNYLMLLWQYQKKGSSFFEHVLWKKGPVLFGVVELLLITLFILFGLVGDPMEQRWLVHLFLVGLISVTYVWIVSFVVTFNQREEAVLKTSYIGTVLLLIVGILFV